MIWLAAITWVFLFVVITVVSYIDLKLSPRLMTTKQCFNSSVLKAMTVSTIIVFLAAVSMIDWAEMTNYRAVFGGY